MAEHDHDATTPPTKQIPPDSPSAASPRSSSRRAQRAGTWLGHRLPHSRRAPLAALTPHLRPLLALGALVLLAQLVLLASHPPIPGGPDSDEYLAAAHNILVHGHFADPLRTPGYPLLLAIIFLLRGTQDLTAVVFVQAGLLLAATFELYLLAVRLSRRVWLACALAALFGANLLVIDWEYSIRPEALAIWTLITLFLLIERLLVALRTRTLLAVAALLFCAIMVRPVDILLPALLALALSARILWTGATRRHRREQIVRVGAMALMVYALTAGYVLYNGATTGYAGLSEASNVNIFGKVIEYRLQDLPVSPPLTPLQRATAQFVEAKGPGEWSIRGQPWAFAQQYGYTTDHYAPLAAYGQYVALHYPERYLPLTLREGVMDWLAGPPVYAPWHQWLASRALYALSRLVFQAYLLLPLLAVLLLLHLRQHPRDHVTFLLLLLLATLTLAIALAAVGCYDEAPRLRAPMDWAVILLTGISLPHVVLPFARAWLPTWLLAHPHVRDAVRNVVVRLPGTQRVHSMASRLR